ncbi:class I SAM-dependent methyltransferase [Caballeronia sordidicola]|jgi:SAM-dependent methyltransferase|uniref:Methyltransferase n=1 Tax=Caballeronia sordidicola TaxID=196367 RepID=A0A226X313_CABSO|nr:class I SAM-dependent methyltransferase [Caballeronia sordidicola]OXC77380.1 Methyltransferase [Caballeronia sordidicola]
MTNEFHEKNRLSWNAATAAHNSHKGDQAAFFRNGGSTLFPEEVELLGGIDGLDLLHLQCNSGQDTLSLARLGANVTGVDISEEAIRFARDLSAQAHIPATFHRADLLTYFTEQARTPGRYDRVFASYGTLCWLSDIDAWAQGVAHSLKPGGRFVLVEFHPFLMIFDEQWEMRYDYFDHSPIASDGVSDYVALSREGLVPDGYEAGFEAFVNPHPSVEFFWGIGDVVSALAKSGLLIEQLREYPYANGWKGFDGMHDSGGRRMVPPQDTVRLPLMYGIAARRPE